MRGGGVDDAHSAGNTVGATLSTGQEAWAGPQVANTITTQGRIGSDARDSGWQIGDNGFIGFKFTANGGADIHYGWGRMSIPGGSNVDGFTVLEAYTKTSVIATRVKLDLPQR